MKPGGVEHGPYASAARGYLALGWAPVPLPYRRKSPPPGGWTGRGAPYPSAADVEAWCETDGDGNLGLRLPTDVLGLDVDHYGDKPGRQTMLTLIGRWGALPRAPYVTARDDGWSGIRLYRVPPDLSWPGEAGPGVEIIQASHRYVVAPPSIHPDTGQPYRWEATPNSGPVSPMTLPWLPPFWQGGLTLGKSDRQAGVPVSTTESRGYVASLPTGPPCPAVDEALTKARLALGNGSRHDAARGGAMRLVRLGEQGHHGAIEAITSLEAAFHIAIDNDPLRPSDPWEWDRILAWTVGEVLADPTSEADRHCCRGWQLDAPTTTDPAAVAVAVYRIASTIDREDVSWLWPGRIPFGKPVMVDGDPGQGKSTLVSADLTARVTTGAKMPDGTGGGRPRGAVILSAEDGAADTIRPRLEAAGADLDRVAIFDGVRIGEDEFGFVVPRDIGVLVDVFRDLDVGLIVLDPLFAYLDSKVDTYKDPAVRQALRPLAKLVEEHRVALAVVRHLNKSQTRSALYRGGGSIAFIGAARAGYVVVSDPADEDRHLFATTKNNIAPKAPTLAYRLQTHPRLGCAVVQWEPEPDPRSALDLLGAGDDQGVQMDAKAWLAEFLGNGPVRSSDLTKAAEAQGYAERTIYRARAALGVEVGKFVTGRAGRFEWWAALPGGLHAMRDGRLP
jgi:hypothetical protein